ncbi:MAG: SLC13/DASS family transporter, partial [Fibrobacter sp.]|nr:SLC13/DASS family transporter [Fibrobacter sp.]
ALAHATGYTDTKGMAITGVVMGLLGLVLSWGMMILLANIHFFGTPEVKAAPAAVEAAAPAAAVEAPAAADTTVAVSADTAAKVEVVDSAAAPAAEAAK